MLTRRERLILLNSIPELSPVACRRLLEAFGDISGVCAARADALQQVEGVPPRLARRIAAACGDEAWLQEEMARAERAGVTIVTLDDERYPQRLRTIPDPPLALYVRGALPDAEGAAVAVVGSRHASLYGTQCARWVGYELALRGVTVVSGLARGIDAAAHEGALKAGGCTVAVLGSGLARLYPPEHGPLAAQISERGAVLSEYPLETPPLPQHFPRRNRLISGLSLGVVVAEAGAHSGALITADCALEQGREVFAIPGPITTPNSHGAHELLKQGARLVTSVEDILEELGLEEPAARPVSGRSIRAETIQLPDREGRVFSCVGECEPIDIDAIAAQSGLAASDVSSALLQLELKRLIQQLPGKQFVKR